MKRGFVFLFLIAICGGALRAQQVDQIDLAEFYKFVGHDPFSGEKVFSRSVGVLYSDGRFVSNFNTTVTGSDYVLLNRRFSLPQSTWDAFENQSPGYYTDFFDRSELAYSVGEGAFQRSYYLVNVNGGDVTPGSIAPFSYPEGWHWTERQWDYSQAGGYWYWIPPGTPYLLNTETNVITGRPIDGWNYFLWPYFYDASTGVWYYIYQDNLPFVYSPDTNEWRQWGTR